jgi:hypothetical protein
VLGPLRSGGARRLGVLAVLTGALRGRRSAHRDEQRVRAGGSVGLRRPRLDVLQWVPLPWAWSRRFIRRPPGAAMRSPQQAPSWSLTLDESHGDRRLAWRPAYLLAASSVGDADVKVLIVIYVERLAVLYVVCSTGPRVHTIWRLQFRRSGWRPF